MPKDLTDLTPEQGGDWRWAFLGMLARSASVSTACTAAGVSRDTAYRHRGRFPRFRAKWDEALEVSVDALAAEARLRAFDRNDPASARMLMFLLKAHRPEVYRDNYRPAVDYSDLDLTRLTDEELEALASGRGLGRG
jgi:hypothetical protein